MRLSAATAAGLAAFLWIVGLANAGVIRTADNEVTEVTSTKVHQPGWPYTGPMGPQGSCCKEGCTDCTWNNCFLHAPCPKDSEYTQCCFDMPVVSMTFSLTVGVSSTPVPESKDTHKIETVASEDLPKSSLVISERGPLSDPYCCKPGCNLCSAQTCFSSNCERNVIYTSCCSDRFLLANAIFVNEIEETPQVPELDAPTPPVQAEFVEHEVRQVEGPNPTPWCCRPGCEVCSGYTCWAGHCPINFASCCADAFLLSQAVFVSDINDPNSASLDLPVSELDAPTPEVDAPTPTVQADSVEHENEARQVEGPNPTPWCCELGCLVCSGWTCWHRECPYTYSSCCADMFLLSTATFVDIGEPTVPDVEISAPEGHSAAISARQPQISGHYGGGGFGYNSLMAPDVDAIVTARQPQISGHYGGAGNNWYTIMAPDADAVVSARQPQVSGHYGGGGAGDNSIEAADAVVTARQPQINGVYGGPGVGGENSILAPNAAVTARQPQIGGIYGGPGVGGENSILAPNAAVTAH